MSRALWFVAGAASGVYTLYKAKRAAQSFTPDGIGARVAALAVGARMFATEVSTGMAERESELRAELRLSSDRQRAIGSAPAPTSQHGGSHNGHG
jgi:Family of unknown function (DUF6167)